MHVYEPIVLSHRCVSKQSWLLIWHSLISNDKHYYFFDFLVLFLSFVFFFFVFDKSIYSPTQAFTTLSMVKPVLHSHRNEPSVFMQFWLLSHDVLSTAHSSMSGICVWNVEFIFVKPIYFLLLIVLRRRYGLLPTHLSKCCLYPFEQVKFRFCGENGTESVLETNR